MHYTFCPNCGRDYGWLHYETGWCKICTIQHAAKKRAKICIVCSEPIFAVRKDAKFCGQCKGYKHRYITAIKAGRTPQEAIQICREKYREDAYVG